MRQVFHIHLFFLNPYNRRARVQPVLLAWLPVLTLPFVFIEFQLDWMTIRWLAPYFVVTMLLVQLGRDRGKKREQELFEEWGGKPSVAMLRHRDGRLAKADKARYRNFLEKHVPGLVLASPNEERESPARADDGYQSAAMWLLAQTRDREQFPLVFEENLNYGFRRNVWALRAPALVADVAAFAGIAAYTFTPWAENFVPTLQSISAAMWVWMAITGLHLFVFSLVIRKEWVKIPAQAFAQQLLATCDNIKTTQHADPQVCQ